MNTSELVYKIRTGEIDCNNQEHFFSKLIKGLVSVLGQEISMYNDYIPHIVIGTGDDIVYLKNKGQDQSIEPYEVSNENYIYNSIPRCMVKPGSVNLIEDQITNPYTNGVFQIDIDNSLHTLVAEFRRMPVKLNVDLKYYLNTYTELLDLTQQIVTKLSFIRTFNIIYMGQLIKCSYKLPDSYEGEFLEELDSTSNESRLRTMSFGLEVEANLPIYSPKTVVDSNKIITNVKTHEKEYELTPGQPVNQKILNTDKKTIKL